LCDPHTGTGVPPATVAEWTLGTNGQPDFYDGNETFLSRISNDVQINLQFHWWMGITFLHGSPITKAVTWLIAQSIWVQIVRRHFD
jgi:hypothetical protein